MSPRALLAALIRRAIENHDHEARTLFRLLVRGDDLSARELRFAVARATWWVRQAAP